MSDPTPIPHHRQPIFNIPPIMVGVLLALALVHGLQSLLSQQHQLEFMLLFSFIPARYDGGIVPLPGGAAAGIWSFITYAMLHADLTHLGVNGIWFLAFGTPLARRFGAGRFLLFCAVTAAAGALAHLIAHAGEFQPMIGASAVVSAAMAAALRFAFRPHGLHWRSDMHLPPVPLRQTLRDPKVLGFLAVWLALNMLFGLGSFETLGIEHSVAWEAHIGGFLAGLLLFDFFDPARHSAAMQKGPADPL